MSEPDTKLHADDVWQEYENCSPENQQEFLLNFMIEFLNPEGKYASVKLHSFRDRYCKKHGIGKSSQTQGSPQELMTQIFFKYIMLGVGNIRNLLTRRPFKTADFAKDLDYYIVNQQRRFHKMTHPDVVKVREGINTFVKHALTSLPPVTLKVTLFEYQLLQELTAVLSQNNRQSVKTFFKTTAERMLDEDACYSTIPAQSLKAYMVIAILTFRYVHNTAFSLGESDVAIITVVQLRAEARRLLLLQAASGEMVACAKKLRSALDDKVAKLKDESIKTKLSSILVMLLADFPDVHAKVRNIMLLFFMLCIFFYECICDSITLFNF